jgi:hypothetical protein
MECVTFQFACIGGQPEREVVSCSIQLILSIDGAQIMDPASIPFFVLKGKNQTNGYNYTSLISHDRRTPANYRRRRCPAPTSSSWPILVPLRWWDPPSSTI